MTNSTVIVFRITASGNDSEVSYALTPMGSEVITGLIRRNGYTPSVRRLRLVDVPKDELDILKGFGNGYVAIR